MDLLADAGEDGLILGLAFLGDPIDHISVLGYGIQHCVNEFHNVHHVLLHEAAGSDGRCADPDSRGLERAAGIERYHVLVQRDLRFLKLLLGHTTCNLRELCPQVNQHQVVIGSARDDFVSLLDELLSHLFGVGHDLLLVLDKLGLHGLVESHGLGGYDVLERTALDTGENA